MKTKKYWILAIMSMVVCCALSLHMKSLGTGLSEEDRFFKEVRIFVLQGIRKICPTVRFVIESGEEGQEKIGTLTKADLQTRVELSLRRTGIEVVESDQLNKNALKLMVAVHVKKIEGIPAYVCVVDAQVLEVVRLVRDPNIAIVTQTWPLLISGESKTVFYAGSLRVQETIKDSLDAKMNLFCNDYLTANHKE